MGVTDSQKIAHNAVNGITGVEDVYIYSSLVSLFLKHLDLYLLDHSLDSELHIHKKMLLLHYFLPEH